MVYRLSYTLDDGRTFIQYGNFIEGTRPFFVNQDLISKFTSVTTLKTISVAEAAIDRYINDTGDNLQFVINAAKTKKGPWTPLTTSQQKLSDLVDTMTSL